MNIKDSATGNLKYSLNPAEFEYGHKNDTSRIVMLDFFPANINTKL